jgi:hypothetical protein
MVGRLLKAGADPRKKDHKGRTPRSNLEAIQSRYLEKAEQMRARARRLRFSDRRKDRNEADALENDAKHNEKWARDLDAPIAALRDKEDELRATDRGG